MNSVALLNNFRCFGISCVRNKKIIKIIKSSKPSSLAWIKRQLTDPYIEKARRENYRCRSAYKLIEIDQRFRILKPGQVVVDCGAAPGSWCQVAVKKTNSAGLSPKKDVGTVIGIDLKMMYPLDGAIFLDKTDFTEEETKERIMNLIKEKNLIRPRGCIDVVLSDMAPNTIGTGSVDHMAIMRIAYNVLEFALQATTLNGALIVKIFLGADSPQFMKDIKQFYTIAKYVKPKACRKEANEMYIVATGFKGIRSGLDTRGY